ncbi:MAG TPA: tryptophan synthase subunit alpha [Thermodesulfovibrionales bacterium]|nr:tryptophan synthase subunit alpha [Thermodesulfovibrionales bacterium]
MNRIEKVFRKLKAENKKAFIPYVMAGDPSLERTAEIVLMLEKCGADIVELGVPFTDPVADGPTIQRASENALKAGVTLRGVMRFVKELRQRTLIPILLMTYYNPVFKYGEEAFVQDAVAAGVDGVIIPDLPPDEAGLLIPIARKAKFATVFLLAPTSTEDRITKVVKASSGFIYYVSMIGITGSRLMLDGSLRESLGAVRRITGKPVAVGFGVSNHEEARLVSEFADGVIVGSAIVKRTNESTESLEMFVNEMRKAIK